MWINFQKVMEKTLVQHLDDVKNELIKLGKVGKGKGNSILAEIGRRSGFAYQTVAKAFKGQLREHVIECVLKHAVDYLKEERSKAEKK